MTNEKLDALRISKIKMQLIEHHPFWGYLLLHTRMTADESLPAIAGTNSIDEIWLNPSFVRELSDPEFGFVLLHELCHQVFDSHHRRCGRNLYLWNCATDYTINRIVLGLRNPLEPANPMYHPPVLSEPVFGNLSVLYNPKFDGLNAEQIYEILNENLQGPALDTEAQTGQESEMIHDRIESFAQNCAAGFDLHQQAQKTWKVKQLHHDRISKAINYWRANHSKGHIPHEALEVRARQQVSREKHLQADIESAIFELCCSAEYCRRKPNKKYLSHGYLVPSVKNKDGRSLIVSLDTSASIDNVDVFKLLSVIDQVRGHFEETTLLVADQDITAVITDDALTDFLRQPKLFGRRGTDHWPVFRWIANQSRRPTCLLALTDLNTRIPRTEPTYPVIWLVPNKTTNRPPWGTLITME